MENKEVVQKLNEVTEVKTMLTELKAFIFGKEENKPTEAVVAEATTTEPVKTEFNFDAFSKEYNEYKTSIAEKFKSSDEKLTAFEAQIKSANDTITKQDEQLKKMFSLVEKALETPVAASSQKAKDKTKSIDVDPLSKEAIAEFRKTHNL